MIRLLVAVSASSLLTLAGAHALRYEPPPTVEAPRPDTTADLLAAAIEGCARADREPVVGIEDGVVVVRCPVPLPNLGTQPAVAWRRR